MTRRALSLLLLLLATPHSHGRAAQPALRHALALRGGRSPTAAPSVLAAGSSSAPSMLEDIASNAKTLLFTEHGQLGTPTRQSVRCSEGYATAATRNCLAGLTCSLAMVPEAISFAFVAGVSPLCGLWTTVVMGCVAAAFGARGGVMTGASGAVAVVVAGLVSKHGAGYLPAAVMLAGALQVLAGYLRLGKYIRLVPHPVMLGFVNGLAVVMTKAQLRHFFDATTGALLVGTRLHAMVGLSVFTAALILMLPLATTAVPSSLLAITIASVVAKLARLPVTTLGDLAGAGTFRGGAAVLPSLALPFSP